MASVHSKKILGEFLDRSDRISAVRSIRDVAIIPEVKLTHLSWKSAFKLLFCLNSVTLFRPRRVIKNQIWSTETNQQHLIPTDCTVLEFSLSRFFLAFMAALQQILLSNHFCPLQIISAEVFCHNIRHFWLISIIFTLKWYTLPSSFGLS